MKTSLVWFRNDLRTIDHQPLKHAATADRTIGFYCFDDQQLGETSFGFPRRGPHRLRFLLESVDDLRKQLRSRGGDLVICRGSTADEMAKLIKQHDITAVCYHDEVGTEERDKQNEIDRRCRELGVPTERFWGHSLVHEDDLPFAVSKMPEVFSPFRRKVEKRFHVRQSTGDVTNLNFTAKNTGRLPTADDLGGPDAEPCDRALRTYHGGQTAGLARLQEYIWENDRLRVYKKTRNGMLSPDDSSKLSPWLALGCLSPRTVYEEVQRYEKQRVANDSTHWLVFELLWRDYFRFIARKHGRKLFRPRGLCDVALPWKSDPTRFEAWQAGQTGYPIIDANMRELARTGYMSNRGRQNVASFLTKNLGIDWRMGAEWFESCLIDYDVASNWGNWNYAAGVGNDPRGFRFFNVIKQAGQYDPDGRYVRHWCPELRRIAPEQVHEPWKMTQEQQKTAGITVGVDFPRPIVDLFRSAESNQQAYDDAMNAASTR